MKVTTFRLLLVGDDIEGRHILQHESNGRLYYCSNLYYSDLNDPIIVDIVTPIFDGQTYRRKQLNMMKFVGDQVEGSMLKARFTANDYQNWSQWRDINLGANTPMLINCGTFKKRAYHFRHATNFPMRLRAVEVQYDIGTL